MTLDELRTMIASSAPRDWSRIKDGFVSDPVPQNFPPGPEAPAALVVRARGCEQQLKGKPERRLAGMRIAAGVKISFLQQHTYLLIMPA